MLREQPGRKLQSLEAPSRPEQPPALILRHVVQRETCQRRERQQQLIEHFPRLVQRCLLKPALHVDHRTPIAHGQARPHLRMLDPSMRKWTFDEVEEGFRSDEATREAMRCLRCWRIGMVAV